MEIQMEGLRILRTMLLGTSKNPYCGIKVISLNQNER
jgi:hypothetical protein